MVEAAAEATVGAGVAPEKMAASGVYLLLMDMGQSVASSRASFFMSLVFILAFPFVVSVNVFAFGEASTSNVFL